MRVMKAVTQNAKLESEFTYLPSHLPTSSPTYLITYLPTYLITYLPTSLPTYLPAYHPLSPTPIHPHSLTHTQIYYTQSTPTSCHPPYRPVQTSPGGTRTVSTSTRYPEVFGFAMSAATDSSVGAADRRSVGPSVVGRSG